MTEPLPGTDTYAAELTAAHRRFATPLEVLSVDTGAGTASVIVVGWSITTPVPVPLPLLVEATGIAAEELAGTWLEAEANCYEPTPERLVLSDITIAPHRPVDWLEGSAARDLYAAGDPDYAIPPGETVLEFLEEAEMTQREFALRANLSTKHLDQLIKGVAPLSPEVSEKLERVTGISARFWNRLEADYQSIRQRLKDGRLPPVPAVRAPGQSELGGGV